MESGESKNLTIKEWDKSERPREKFLSLGGANLTNTELLAIIIGSGTKECNALELSRRLMAAADNNLNVLKKFQKDNLLKFKGIGQMKAVIIMAVFELIRRVEADKIAKPLYITSSATVADIMRPILKDLDHEECWVLFLNKNNRIVAKEKISSGGVSSTVLDIKIIIKRAMANLACGIILIHNHPSGTLKPGEQDITRTAKLKQAATTCDITLLDHIIIAGRGYYSFADECIL